MSTPAGRLRRATRLMSEASEDALDERERFGRGEALRVVHPLLGLLLGLLFVAAVIDGGVVRVAWEPLIGGAILTSVLLPSAVPAWRWAGAPPGRG
ncbi:hypothetical protein [Nonomuraea pusilla]|uniref:Uncharacterized protein n=1 Tax=Nonomuraea pusilla TaxID=46177 RepID=A0A1H7UDZ7_9ACTN|nr:hypothetical protein [Nonomuraea pusilla]SEL95049.1 hypothetical protein SAMN05660976_03771 [Nonomuraea pusilla]